MAGVATVLAVVVHAPGVIMHEAAHHLFCLLSGVRVHQVVYFRLGNPAGYVVHSTPQRFRCQLAIVGGPLLANSVLTYLLFGLAVHKMPALDRVVDSLVWRFASASPMVSGADPRLGDVAVVLACLWLGSSTAIHAFPSSGDARVLWTASGAQLRRRNLLAVLGYPVALVIWLLNLLKSLHLHWIYAGAMLWLAYDSPWRWTTLLERLPALTP